ncbi:MAG: AAA family ATPase [Bacteroidota bacterium]|nr:AAA family ATPase [Bacteroidota bacterium]
MQKIDTIEIKNFKSIRHQKIEGCKRINVFIGYPNVGKSNILEALSLFSVRKNESNFLDFVRLENLTTFFFNGNIEEKSEVRINDINRALVEIKFDKLSVSIQVDREKYGFDKINDDALEFKIDRKEAGIVASYDVNESDKKVYNFSGNTPIRLTDSKKSGIFKYEYRKNIIHAGKDYWSLNHPFGENLFSVLFNNSELYKEVQELFSFYDLELIFDFREQKLSILKRIQKGIFSIPFELVADTLQRLIFYKASIRSNKDSILLFEEPEAHMFPPYVKKFTTDVIFDETNQFFIATHSPYILTEFIEEAEDDLAIYVVDYDKGETVIKRLSDNQVTEVAQYGIDLFFNLEPYLDKYGQPHSA